MLSEKVRIFDKKVTEIRVSEIRISSNHRELYGAIFSLGTNLGSYNFKYSKETFGYPCAEV